MHGTQQNVLMGALRFILISLLGLSTVFAPPPLPIEGAQNGATFRVLDANDVTIASLQMPDRYLEKYLFQYVVSRLHTEDDLVRESARLDAVIDAYDMQIIVVNRILELTEKRKNLDLTLRQSRLLNEEFFLLKAQAFSIFCACSVSEFYTFTYGTLLGWFNLDEFSEYCVRECLKPKISELDKTRNAALVFKGVLHTYLPQAHLVPPPPPKTIISRLHEYHAADRPMPVPHLDPHIFDHVLENLKHPFNLEDGLTWIDIFVRSYDMQDLVLTRMFELVSEAQDPAITPLASEALNIRLAQQLLLFERMTTRYDLKTTWPAALGIEGIQVSSKDDAHAAERELIRAKSEFDKIRGAALAFKDLLPDYLEARE